VSQSDVNHELTLPQYSTFRIRFQICISAIRTYIRQLKYWISNYVSSRQLSAQTHGKRFAIEGRGLNNLKRFVIQCINVRIYILNIVYTEPLTYCIRYQNCLQYITAMQSLSELSQLSVYNNHIICL
jgi:hypothetical protein